jgi:hypothetical protein
MQDTTQWAERGLVLLPKSDGGTLVFSAEDFSALETADAGQEGAKVWLRGAWMPVAVACSADEVLDLLTRAVAAANRIKAATNEEAVVRLAVQLAAAVRATAGVETYH